MTGLEWIVGEAGYQGHGSYVACFLATSADSDGSGNPDHISYGAEDGCGQSPNTAVRAFGQPILYYDSVTTRYILQWGSDIGATFDNTCYCGGSPFATGDYTTGPPGSGPSWPKQVVDGTWLDIGDLGYGGMKWDYYNSDCAPGSTPDWLSCFFAGSVFTFVPDGQSSLTILDGYLNTALGELTSLESTAISQAQALANQAQALANQEQQDAQCVAGQAGNNPPAPDSNQPACQTVAADATQAPPSNISAPVVTGPPIEEHTLTASQGAWSGQGNSYAFQWQRCDSNGANCANIAGATSNMYVPVAADIGATLRVVVGASNAYGASYAQSTQTPAIQRNATCQAPASNHLPICARPNQWLYGATGIAFKTDDFGADSGYRDRRKQARAALADLKRAGANTFVLPLFYFIDPSDNSTVTRKIDPNANESTLKDEDVYNAACDARRARIGNIVLKLQFPSLDPTTFTPSSLGTWRSTYRSAVIHATNLAIRIGAHGLLIGNELKLLTQNADDSNYWSGVISAIKNQRDGHILCPHNPSSNARYIVGRRSMTIRTAPTGLTFGVNWDQVQAAPSNAGLQFLSQLDYVGVSAYFPLSTAASPSASDIYSGWGHGPYDPGGPTGPYQQLDSLYNHFHKKIVFTELGFTACTSTAVAQPWQDCTAQAGSSVSESLKDRAYQETFQSIHDKKPSWLRGVWAWNWGLLLGEEQARPYGFQLRNSTASQVVCSWYKLSGACSGTFNTQSAANADLPTCSQADDTVAATYGNDDVDVDVEAFCAQLAQPDAESLAPSPSADQSIAGLSDPSNPPPADGTGLTSGDPNDVVTPVPPDGQ